jgi:hypothetical protein
MEIQPCLLELGSSKKAPGPELKRNLENERMIGTRLYRGGNCSYAVAGKVILTWDADEQVDAVPWIGLAGAAIV